MRNFKQTANPRTDNIISLVPLVTDEVLFFFRRKSEFEMLTDTTKQTPIFTRKLNSSRFSFPRCLAFLPSFPRLLFKHFSCVGKPPGGVCTGKIMWLGLEAWLSGRRHRPCAGFQELFSVAELLTAFPGEKDKQPKGNVETIYRLRPLEIAG